MNESNFGIGLAFFLCIAVPVVIITWAMAIAIVIDAINSWKRWRSKRND